MTTLAIVVTLVGQAWAENANGERRALEVGDQLAVDETLIMAEGARIDLDFGDNQQLTFLGEQQVTPEVRGDLIEQTESLSSLETNDLPEPVTPIESDRGGLSEGHRFVQLVRIGEIIEADGYTPVTVARIQEVLRPFGMSIPQQEFVRGSERDGTRYDEQSYPETGLKLAKLSISIDAITGDDIVDATEAGQPVTLTGTVGGGVSPGDTVAVTVNGQLYNTTVNADGRTWQVDVPGSELAKDNKVQATVNSVEPNGTPVSESAERPYWADDITPSVSVELEQGSGPNGDYNNSDLNDGKVSGTITFDPNTTVPGDRITATDKDGNPIFDANGDPLTDFELTQNDIDNGIVVDVPVAPGENYVELNVDVTDPAGNTSTGFDNNPKDDITPTADVVLEPGSGPNGEYNDNDTSDGKVEGTITFDPNTSVPGDKITVTDKDGNPILDGNGDPITDYEITQGDIDNGITVEVPVDPGQTDVELNVDITDPAGNTSTGSDNKVVDNTTPGATATLEPGSGSNGEYNDDDTKDGKVTGTVTFDPDTSVGDTVKITDKDGNVIIERPVTQGDIDNGITVDIPVADGQTNVEMNVQVTDPAGNTSSTDDSNTIDSVIPTVGVTLDGAGPDGVYNESEIINGEVPATITLDPTVEEGDVIEYADGNGDPIAGLPPHTVTATDITNGSISVQVPVAPGQTNVELNATATDPAGNTSTASDNKPVDNLPPETVTPITDQTSDDADVVSLDISGNFNDLVSGSDIAYSASGLPDGLSIDPDTGIISGTIDKSASQFGGNGEHTVTVTVTDEAGNSDDVNFNWGVNNPAPVAVDDTAIATEDQTLTVSAADGVLANDYDPDGDTPLVVTDYTINGQPYNAGDTATVTGVGQITLNADGSYEFVPEADYNGAVPPISYTVEDADGGTDTGELVISMDPVLDITLSAAAQVNEGDKITLTASVESPVQGSPLYVVLDNGQTITIPVGATSGTLDVDSRPDDEYVQGQTNQTFEVVSASGGTETINSSSFGATTTVGIVDADSTVTARLSVDKTSTEEGAADLVYTVTLEDANGNAIAANNDVTVVTTQGSITITAGNSTGTLGVAVQGDDVYIDGETVSNEITSVSEANAGSAGSFENLDFDGAPVQTVVKDTIDPVFAIIEVDNDAVLEGGALTYTVKLVDANGDPAPAAAGKDVTVNLGWSGAAANTADVDALPASVTISGGSAANSFVVNTNSDTVAELSESITVTIDSVVDNAGTDPGFENLQVGSSGNSATAQVIDAPSIKVLDDNGAAAGQLTVNEQGLDTNDGSNTVSGVLRMTAPSGLQSIEIGGQSFTLAQIENLASSNQTITVAGHGEITLKASSVVETANGQNAVWEVDFDYELTDAQTHTAQGADNALKDIPLGVSAADPQDANNSVTGSGNLGVLVTDDTPDVDLTGAKLDEAQVEEGQIGTPGGAEATVDFSGAFDINHGADGDNGIVYELVIDSTASGLVDTASGDAVELFDNNGMVEGRNSNGDVVFTITVDGTTGEVTLVQNRALAHQDPLTPNDTVKITNGAISLKATATDGDNDTDTAKVNIGDRFVFRDDGPTAVADSANATEGGSTNGNVLGNDEPGSDGWANNGNAVVGVISGGGSAVENANVGQPVSGLYGTLTLNADGSYDYQANPDAVTADAQDVFTYTVKDGDGDLAETTLTINVADVSLLPVNTTDSVDESGLAGGSTAGDGSQIATGQVALPIGVEAIPQANIPTEHGEFSIDKDGNYTYTLTGSTDGDAVTDSFEYTTQDADGNTVTNTVTINIADDQPVVAADSGSVNEGATLTVGAGSGVLANDQSGADGWDTNGAVVGVTAGNTATNSTGGVGGRIDGDYGHLTLNADGSYTYVSTADAITADAQDVFTYTVRDADGDLAHTTLTIDVANESVPVTSISETVNESGLAGGSTEGDSSHISSGSVTLPAGVEVIPQNNINTAHGVFSIDANGNYSYTLTGNTNGDNVTDSFTYTTKDALGNTVINNATMMIVDDEPTALNDTNSITEDDAFIVGNVIAGDTDGGVADTLGADGATVTAITNNSSTSTTDANGNLVIQGEYGKLTISADGSYQYELDNSNPAVNALKDGVDLTENFTYTLTDGDGDADTAQLDITINGRTDGAPSITPVDDNGKDNSSNINTIGHVNVKESGLAGGSTAGSGHIETGSIDIAAGDGLASINVAGTAITLAQLQAIDSGDSSTHITIAGTAGELTLTGFDSTTNVGGVPTLGKLHFSYELTAAQNTPADSNDPSAGLNSTDDFALTVTDAGGADSSGTLVVNIIDDVPVAADDANSIVEDAAAPVTGNVIGNDTVGADGAGVTAISSVNVAGNTATNAGGVLEIDGAFGTLTINPDGSYSYALDNSSLAVQGLTDTESLTETFTYTLTDGDGDTASANLDLTINGTDDAVTVTVPVDDAATTPDGNTADHVVFESALAAGSAPGAADTQVVSSFTVVALDGLAAGNGVSLAYTNVNGQARTLELSKAQVEALGTQSQTIDTQYGEMVLNGSSQAADGTITINYSYTLERAPQVTGDDTSDNIEITATDRDGDTDSQTLGIKVVDDAPTAVADVNDITEDAISVTGNVVANDTLGADGADVSAISSTNVPGNSATESAGVLEIDGAYGTLTINPDGSYTYALDNTNLTVQGLSNAETLTETFSYTLTDGDSDSDTADLVITINGTNDGVSLDIPVDNSAITPDGNTSDQVVFESGLANGSNPNPADTRVVSSFTVKALDGVDATEAVTVSYTDASGNPANLVLSQSELENLGTANQTLTTEYGELLLNGYTQAADGTITVNYEYTLNNAPDVDATDTNDAFGIAVKDKDGDTDSQNLTIKIVDDAPSIENTGAVLPEVQVSESALGTTVSGDFSGAFSETLGADGGTVAYQLVVDNAVSGLMDTASGEPINLVNNNGVIEGRTATGNDLAFTVVVDANGNVTLEQNRALQHSDTNTPSDVLRIANGALSLQATATDDDGDTDTASVAIGDRLAFQDDGPVASDDTATIDEDGATPATGSVVANDTLGGDGASVTGITSNNVPGNTATDNSGVLTLEGQYGTLIIDPDGSYSYALDNNNAAVNALKDGESLPESFNYTLTDGDGDTSTANLTITINGNTDGAPAITAEDGNGPDDVNDITTLGDLTVQESGLTDSSGTHTGTGTINISAADGLASIRVGGKTISLSDLQGLNTGTPGSHIIINTDEGQLTLTNFNATSDVGGVPIAGELEYSYELTNVQNTPADPNDADVGRNSNDTIALEVTDAGGETSQSDLTINIIDDTPQANADTGTVTEGSTLTVSANDGVLSNDAPGADGWDANGGVVGVVAGGGSGTTDDAATVGQAINGTYGVLTLNADGSYSYVSTANAVTADAQDVFTYTVKDGDGDLVEATLTIDVNDVTGTPQTTTATVDEAGLANGTEAGGDSHKITGGQLVLDNGWTVNGAQSGTTTNGSWSVATDGTFSYELTGATTEGTDDTDSFTYEVVDQFGNTVTNTVNINITDDTPQAVDDVTNISEDGAVSVTGDVFANDELGADTQANPVTEVSFGGTIGTIGTGLNGQFGELTLNADGTYSYALDNDNAVVNALKDGETLTEDFSYTITDGDGDTSTATLTITIDGNTDGAPVIAADDGNGTDDPNDLATIGDITVYEKGLVDSDDSDKGTGSIAISTPDGLDSISIGGTVIDLATLQGLNPGDANTYITVATDEGTLTVTGFTPSTTVGGVPTEASLDYSYELSAATNTAADPNDPDAGRNGLDVVDLEVTDAGGGTSSGELTINIIDDTPTAINDTATAPANDFAPVTGGVMTNDREGADGARVTQITDADNNQIIVPATGNAVINGTHGKLTIASDGSYSYQRNPGSEGGVSDEFTYTLTDGDGDTASASLTVTIGNSSPVITSIPANAEVNESGMPNGSGTAPNNASTQGQITFTSPDGVSNVSLGGHTLTDVDQTFADGLTARYSYDPVTGQGTIHYDYTLQNTTTGDNTQVDFAIEITDQDGDTSSPGDLTVAIVDDVPIATPDTADVTEGDTVSGNVLTNDISGADGWSTAGAVAGIKKGGGTAGENGAVGQIVYGEYGNLILEADGSYTYESTADKITADAQDVFTYTIRDADGDLVKTTLTINVNNVSGTPQITTATVDEAGLATGTDAGNGHIASGNLSLDTGWSVATPQSGTSTHGTWSVATDGTFSYELNSATTEGSNDTDTFSYTSVDQYGNSIANTVKISIKDDEPRVVSTGNALSEILVAESALGTEVTADFKGAFSHQFGADGAATTDSITYDLVINNSTSGLIDTATGEPVNLVLNGDVIEGVVNGTSDVAFTISVDGNGVVSLTQNSALQHNDASTANDIVKIAGGALSLQATVTDADGDSDTASVVIGDRFVFQDDGPTITAAPAVGEVDEKHLASGSAPDAAETTITTNLNVDFGADGVGSLRFLDASEQHALRAWLDASGNNDIEYTVNGDVLTATRNGGADEVFTVKLDVDPVSGQASYTFELKGAMYHASSAPHRLTFNYQATDGDNDTKESTFVVNVIDDVPVINPGTSTVELEVTEADLDLITDPSNPVFASTSADFSGLFAIAGADAGTITYGLSIDDTATGFTDTVTGQAIVLKEVGGVIGGYTSGSDELAFTVGIDTGSGEVTLTQQRAITHPDQGTDKLSLPNGSISMTVSVNDGDGDTATGSAPIGERLTFVDDIPVVTQDTTNTVAVEVDESTFASNDAADFSVLFGVDHGADGEAASNATVYTLSADTVNGSGLVDSLSSQDVALAINGSGTVVTGTAGGNTVFTITIDSATGEITLDQQRAVKHSDTADHNDAVSIDTSAVSITATATDGDSDTTTSTVEIGDRFTFLDDGPSITVNATQVGAIELDETNLTGASHSTTNANFAAGVFTTDFGADGAASTAGFVYSLTVSGNAVSSGLTDTASGEDVLLRVNGSGEVEGYTAGGNQIVFTVSVDSATGALTLEQVRTLSHPDTTNHDDVVSILDSTIQLVGTATDGDGDTAEQSINIGGQITFRDDGPSITAVTAETTVDEKGLQAGSAPDGNLLTASASLNVDFGGDGAGDVQFTAATVTALEGLSLKAGGTGLEFVIDNDNHSLTAYRGAGRAATDKVFTVDITDSSGTPSYDFVLNAPIDHAGAPDLTLAFQDIRVTDADGDSVVKDFNVKVLDDASQSTMAQTVDEDGTVTFNTSADADPDNTTIYKAGGVDPWPVTTTHGDGSKDYATDYGTVTVNADGTITYAPNAYYSGEEVFVFKTQDGTTTDETTVTMTVTPVADAPRLEADKTRTTTPEDVSIALGLQMPVITDDTDQNGAAAGDDPERLGEITLSLTGTAIGTLTNAADAAYTDDGNGVYKFVITDVTDLHLDGLTSAADPTVNYVTQAEYEAIKALPSADRHENFDVEVSVRSYEVDASGAALPDAQVGDVNGAQSTQTITVDVHAVTDAVGLKVQQGAAQPDVSVVISGSDKVADVTFNEDNSFNLTSILNPYAFVDTDGSETRYLGIDGLPDGTVVNVDGSNFTIGAGSITTFDFGDGNGAVPAIEIAGTQTALPVITITPPADFSGDISGDINSLTVTLGARDSDSDSTVTPDLVTDAVTINLHVNPIAGDVGLAANDVTTPEDTAVAFLENVEVTDTIVDGGTERITQVEFTLPADWVLTDKPAAGEGTDWGITGSDASGYTISALASGYDLQSVLKDFTITPAPHSSVDETITSVDETITVAVTSEDTNMVAGAEVISPAVTRNLDINVEVTAVAEELGPDLTMSGDHTYATNAVEEDVWFDLHQGSVLDGWENQDKDGSEDTFALFTPILTDGTGPVSANGSQFQYSTDGGTTFVTQTYNGTAIEVPIEYLDSLKFKAPQDFAGNFEIKVTAKTVDTDPDSGQTSTYISDPSVAGEFSTLTGSIDPVADEVNLAVSGRARGDEDTEIPLNIRVSSSDIDASETITLTLSDIPAGAELKYDGTTLTLIDDGKGNGTFGVTIEEFDRSKPMTIRPPEHSNEDFPIGLSAFSVDEFGGVTDTSAAKTGQVQVIVRGVADDASLTVANPVFAEADVDAAASTVAIDGFGSVNLNEVITGATLVDNDGSEKLTIKISGLDPEFHITGASLIGGTGTGRVWVLTQDELANAKVLLPINFSGKVTANATAVTTENDGNAKSNPSVVPLEFTVTPSIDETIKPGTSNLQEDSLHRVDFSLLAPNEGDDRVVDTDEELTAIWIATADADTSEYTLYFGNTGKTLAQAVTDGEPGIVLDGGEYKITGAGIGNIYAQGAPNLHGNLTFNVGYEITDPSSDGTLLATVERTDITHTLEIAAVTDPATLVINSITADTASTTITDTTAVDAIENTSLTVNVTLSKDQDANGNNERDYDGSETITRVFVDGVPAGVTVDGAVYIGNVPGSGNTGRWLLSGQPTGKNMTGEETFDLVIGLTGSAANLSNLNQELSIRVATEDAGNSAEHVASDSFTLTTPATFDDTNSETDQLAVIVNWADEPTFVATEDTSFKLSDALVGEITGSSDFAITITGLPAGTVVSGMTMTDSDGNPNGFNTWTVSGAGSDADLQALLDSIEVNLPEHWNSIAYAGAEFEFDTTLTTYAGVGDRNAADARVSQVVTPVTDAAVITISNAETVNEDATVEFTVAIDNPADSAGNASNLVDGKLYLQITETDMAGGTLSYGGMSLALQNIVGVEGVADGQYYVADLGDGVGMGHGTSVVVSYQPPLHQSGTVSLEAWAPTKETDAANTVASVTSVDSNGEVAVVPVNDGFDIQAANVSGDEDSLIELAISGAGLIDNDGSEEVKSVLLTGLPDDFLVYVSNNADGSGAVLANNAGANGWAIIPTVAGQLPPYIAVQPPLHWNGTASVGITALTGEKALLDVESSTTSFDIEVVPVADGLDIAPLNTSGTEGDIIAIDINPSLVDRNEAVNLQIEGLGEYAAFHLNGNLMTTGVSYDELTDTYTLNGLTEAELGQLGFVQSAGTYTVDVSAQTVDGTDVSTPVVTDSFIATINPVAPTAGDDTLLYGGLPIDAGAGDDTIQLRFGEDVTASDLASNLDNVEVLDLGVVGENAIGDDVAGLSIQDVLDITDSRNALKIDGDSYDSVFLKNSEWTTNNTGPGGYVTYTSTDTSATLNISDQITSITMVD